MAIADDARSRGVFEFYAPPALEWQLRMVGPHLHPGFEMATVALAERAAHYGFAEGGRVVDLASALGGPARFVARRFAATVVCVDFNPAMQQARARVARSGPTRDDAQTLARDWAFPTLLRLPEYAVLLDGCGFEVLLAEDRTRAVAAQHSRATPTDQPQWDADFSARHGQAEARRQVALAEVWANPVRAERAGYAMLIARRRQAARA
jgi:hypothetical protein